MKQKEKEEEEGAFQKYDYYKVNRILMYITGVTPYLPFNFYSVLRCIFVFLTSLCFIVTTTGAIVTSHWAWDAMVESLPLVFAGNFVVLKWLNYIINRKKMQVLINRINDNWKLDFPSDELDIMKYHANKGRFYSINYVVVIYIVVSSYYIQHQFPVLLDTILPNLNQSREHERLFYKADYFIDMEKYQTWILTHMLLTGASNMTLILTADCMFLLYIQHACGLFKIAGYRMEHVFNRYKETPVGRTTTPNTELEMRDLGRCISMHQRAIEFCDLVEDAHHKALFFQLGFMILCLTASLLQLTIYDLNTVEAVGAAEYVFGQFVHLFYCSYPAQEIIDLSTDVLEKAYSSIWYKASVRTRKMLILIIERATKPSQLTAGGIYTFSMQSLATVKKSFLRVTAPLLVVQTSFSYFTMVSSVR